MSEVIKWLEYGGVMLVPIIVASMVGVTLFVARWRAHRQQRVIPGALRRAVLDALDQEGGEEAAVKLLDGQRSVLARVFLEGLRFRGAQRREIREAMQEVGRREMTRLERYVGAVGAAASVTPLMGLLGTVLGMIRVFQSVVNEASATGGVDPTALAGGIWEALITTAAGLLVAIPLYLGYRYLIGRLDALSVELEEAAGELLDRLAPPPHSVHSRQAPGAVGAAELTSGEASSSALAAEGA